MKNLRCVCSRLLARSIWGGADPEVQGAGRRAGGCQFDIKAPGVAPGSPSQSHRPQGQAGWAVSHLPSALRADPSVLATGNGVLRHTSVRTQTWCLSGFQFEACGEHAAEVRTSYFLVSGPPSGSFNEDLIILRGRNLGTRASWEYKNVTWACPPSGNSCWGNFI